MQPAVSEPSDGATTAASHHPTEVSRTPPDTRTAAPASGSPTAQPVTGVKDRVPSATAARKPHFLLATGIVAITIYAGIVIQRQWALSHAFPEGLLQVNGRIEGDRVTLASKFGGRVEQLLVDEADTVRKGQVLLRLDDAQTRAQLQQAAAVVEATAADARGAGQSVQLTAETGGAQIQQAEALLAQAESSIVTARAEAGRAAAALTGSRAASGTSQAKIRTAAAAGEAAAAGRLGALEDVRVAEAGSEAAVASRQRAEEAVTGAMAQVEAARALLRALQASGDAAAAGYEKARRDARRYRLLYEEGAASAATRDAYTAAEKTTLAQLTSAREQAAAAEREVAAREAAVNGARQQVREAQAQVAARQAELSARRRQVTAAEAHVRQADAETQAARAQAHAAGADVGQAQAQLRAAQEQVRRAEAVRRQAQGQVDQARTSPRQVAVRRTDRQQAEARRRQAEARVRELHSILADTIIRAPVSGTVTTRLQDGGEVVAAGSPLLELVNLDALYLKVYVPEDQIGKIRIGLPAQVYTDAFPRRPFPATVRSIAAQAEFTPKEVQTRDERVKLVYAVKLYLDQNPEHRLTPGLPADAVIRWKPGTPWQAPQW